MEGWWVPTVIIVVTFVVALLLRGLIMWWSGIGELVRVVERIESKLDDKDAPKDIPKGCGPVPRNKFEI